MVFHVHNKAACTVMSLQQFGFSRGPSKHTGPSATEAAPPVVLHIYFYLNFMLATELVANEATCFSDPAIGLLSDLHTHTNKHTHIRTGAMVVPVSWTSEKTNGLSSGWSLRKSSSILLSLHTPVSVVVT